MSSTNNNGPTTSSSSQLSLPVHYLTLDGGSFIQCKCTDSKYTILVLSQGTTVYLSGVFSFQVLYGFVEVNGFLFAPKKYNPANFVPTCIPMGHMPASFAIRNELSIELHVERIQSRLREFINDPRKVIAFVEERKPVAILLIRLENVITAKLIQQQMPQNIFPPIGKVLGNRLYFANPAATELLKWMTLDEFEAHKMLANEQQTVVNRIYQNVEQDGKCIVFLAGNKGAGKSTMARYLLNALNSGVSDQPPKPGCRTFLLDADVGQSELCPPGCVSMCEVKNPLIGAPFASPLTTLPLSYFFGAISPGVDMDFYVKLVGHLLDKFNAQLAAEEVKPQENQQKFVLIVNSVGWIEDLGYDLMLRLLRLVKPTILVNLEINWMLNFTVPDNYRRITTTIRRTAASSDQKLTAPQLRNFMMAGYLAQTFLQTERPFLSVLRLAELPAYRVRFGSTAIYLHPEMRRIDDKLLLPFLNCVFVALCRVEQGFEKHFVHKRLLDNPSMPSRLEFQQALPNEDQHQLMSSSRESDQQHSNDNVDDANTSADFADADDDSSDSGMDVIPVEEQLGAVPMLRCLGFGLIRAINPQRKLFYVVTPTDPQALRRVNVFACGHSLNVPEMLFFDANVNEPAPYIVELDGELRDDYRKFFSPLRNITGGKRAFQAKRGQHYEKK